MSKKYILQQFFHRTSYPTRGDKRFGRGLVLCAVALLIAGFGRIFSIGNDAASTIFDWLVGLSLAAILIVDIMAITWRVYDIIRQMEMDQYKK